MFPDSRRHLRLFFLRTKYPTSNTADINKKLADSFPDEKKRRWDDGLSSSDLDQWASKEEAGSRRRIQIVGPSIISTATLGGPQGKGGLRGDHSVRRHAELCDHRKRGMTRPNPRVSVRRLWRKQVLRFRLSSGTWGTPARMQVKGRDQETTQEKPSIYRDPRK